MDHVCPGFVQVSSDVALGSRLTPVSIYGGPQYQINLMLFKV
jgi:Neprosin